MRFLFIFIIVFCISIQKPIESFGKNVVQIALNINDCANCINNLRLLNDLDSTIGIQLVVQNANKEFENDIHKMFSIRNGKYSIAFDDTLYNLLILNNVNSSISIYNEYSNIIANRYSLKTGLTPKLIQYYNKLNSDTSTFLFNQRFAMLASEAIVRDRSFAYSFSRRLPYVLRMDFVNEQVDTVVTLNSPIAKVVYNKFFESKAEAEKQIELMATANLNLSSILKVATSPNGNILVAVNYLYLAFKNDFKDTAVRGFTAVLEFDRGEELLSTHIIRMEKLRKEVDPSCAIRGGDFGIVKDTVIASLICLSNDKEKSSKFLAYFIRNKNGDYEFFDVFPRSLPKVYEDYGHNYSQPVYSNTMTYVGVLLSDTIFSLVGKMEISLGVFKKPQFSGNPLKFNYILNSIDIFGNYLYATYSDQSIGGKLFLNKVNLETGKTELHKELTDYSRDKNLLFMYFDAFDPDYYYLKTSSEEVIRVHI